MCNPLSMEGRYKIECLCRVVNRRLLSCLGAVFYKAEAH
jgi:hypothetical protein